MTSWRQTCNLVIMCNWDFSRFCCFFCAVFQLFTCFIYLTMNVYHISSFCLTFHQVNSAWRVCLFQCKGSALGIWQHQDSGPARRHLRWQRLHPHGHSGRLYCLSAQKRTETAGEIYKYSAWQILLFSGLLSTSQFWHVSCFLQFLCKQTLDVVQSIHVIEYSWDNINNVYTLMICGSIWYGHFAEKKNKTKYRSTSTKSSDQYAKIAIPCKARLYSLAHFYMCYFISALFTG